MLNSCKKHLKVSRCTIAIKKHKRKTQDPQTNHWIGTIANHQSLENDVLMGQRHPMRNPATQNDVQMGPQHLSPKSSSKSTSIRMRNNHEHGCEASAQRKMQQFQAMNIKTNERGQKWAWIRNTHALNSKCTNSNQWTSKQMRSQQHQCTQPHHATWCANNSECKHVAN